MGERSVYEIIGGEEDVRDIAKRFLMPCMLREFRYPSLGGPKVYIGPKSNIFSLLVEGIFSGEGQRNRCRKCHREPLSKKRSNG